MPIQNMLELSSEHLRKQDREALELLSDGQPSATPHVYPTQDGVYVTTGIMFAGSMEEGAERLEALGFTEEFAALMIHAAQQGCAMMHFDNEAEPEPGFPLFGQETDEAIDSSSLGM